MHEELIYRLKPIVRSNDERWISSLDWETDRNQTGVTVDTVDGISAYLRNLCGELMKAK